MPTFSPTYLSPLDVGKEYYAAYNETVFPNSTHSNDEPGFIMNYLLAYVVPGIIILIYILGLLGNGAVTWLLGFCIKRNPFTTYILNLAIADFALLAVHSSALICAMGNWFSINLLRDIINFFVMSMFTAGQFLLTAISTDRCVSLLFPLWYRCHRPPHLSIIVCALIWIYSFLVPGIGGTLLLANEGRYALIFYIQDSVSCFLCLPLMTISALLLFMKFCFKSQQWRRGKLLTVILHTLLFFIIFSFPANLCFISQAFHLKIPYICEYTILCGSLNNSVNPFLYFLLGRQKRGRPRKSMKEILQNVFKEEENSTKKVGTSIETQL